MIVFALRCADEHEFEAWFHDGAAFDAQSAASEIACPICGDRRVTKAPMAPRLGRSRDTENTEAAARMMRKALLELRHHVETNCDYVGDQFAEEARRIHYGESERRGIYGEASKDDAESLAEEGIEVSRIPWPATTDA